MQPLAQFSAARGLSYIGQTRVGSPQAKAGITHMVYDTAAGSGGGGGGGSVKVPSASSGGSTSVASSGGGSSDYASLYKQILDRFSEGGTSLQADLAEIEAGKKQAIASGEQNIISSGLSGTTVMAGVPIAAEKGAATARIRARSAAEEKYLGALTSFANLSFQAEENRLGREQSRLNLEAQLKAQANAPRSGGSSVYIPESERYAGGTGPGVAYGSTPTITAPATSNYSQQFPTLYGQGSQLPPAPDWTGGTSTTPWTSGGYTSTSLAGMSAEELKAYYDKYV